MPRVAGAHCNVGVDLLARAPPGPVTKPGGVPDDRNVVQTAHEPRTRFGLQLDDRVMRWRRSALPIVQAAVAAGLAWLIAAHIVGHRSPFFAPIAAVIALGFTLDQRLRRAIELIVGVSLGVGVGDLFISVIGTGPWQIALVVALAMSIAALIDGGAVITVQAAVSPAP